MAKGGSSGTHVLPERARGRSAKLGRLLAGGTVVDAAVQHPSSRAVTVPWMSTQAIEAFEECQE